jgi:hypothetical protein
MDVKRLTPRRVAKSVKRRIKARTAPTRELAKPRARIETFEVDQMIGWVEARRGGPPVRVTVWVNDFEAVGVWAIDRWEGTATVATGKHTEIRGFRLVFRDIWRFCRRDDKITVRVNGHPIPFRDGEKVRHPANDGKAPMARLKRKLRNGYVFSHGGHLQLSKAYDADWQRTVMALYDRVRKVVSEQFGQDVFAVYGSLLGAVREHSFIGHDRDFDCAFVANATTGPEAARELQQIAFALVEEGLDVQCRATAIHIHDVTDPRIRIDLFHLFFDDEGRLSFPFGVAGTTTFTKDQWTGFTEVQLGPGRVLLPKKAEALTAHIYGENWRVPKPGFDWARDRTNAAHGAGVPAPLRNEVFWANYYARNEISPPSAFSEWVLSHADVPSTVVDLGSGEGRDSRAFARSKRRVVGLDRSSVGVRRAREYADREGASEATRFEVVDFEDLDAVRSVLATVRADGEPVLIYLRFMLHAISEEVQAGLLEALGDFVQPGDWLAAEFRTEADKDLRKNYRADHYRRFLDVDTFRSALAELKFDVKDEQQGTGLSPYGEEDPDVYRVVAHRSAG